MIRIGVVNIDVSHPAAFADYLHKGNRARYVAVYNDGFRSDEEVDAYISKYGLEKRCQSVDELADYVDVGFVQGCNWDKHLEYAAPFIARGKPVFIDKPMVGNIADCRKLQEYIRGGAVILGSSAARYAPDIEEFLSIPVEERGEIINVYGTSGVDDFNYGIHVIELFGGLLGSGAQSCRFAGRAMSDGKPCDTYLISYQSGINAVYTLYTGKFRPFTLTIMTNRDTYNFKLRGDYSGFLDRICTQLETGKPSLAGIDDQIECIKILLAGRISKLNGGQVVSLADIPADDPGYDGFAFEKEYAAANTKKK